MARTFYQACAQGAFALLGLWWVVVNRKYDDWVHDAFRRRQAYVVSLYFALPAVTSLVSLISDESKVIWRVGFSAAALLGMLVALSVLVRDGSRLSPGLLLAHAANALLYALVLLIALATTIPADIGLDLSPREVEAVLVTGLMFIGVNLAWALFMTPARERGS